ncbi:MAG: GNAT family N-acetyltransferase [Cytophagaceae bacterium]|jgi:diamine N-acetyltransferase|nr:GNAT family N-acetyltransferase [Cytophagaceae bacterium]
MIETENLILRAVEPADVDLLYEWENDMRLWQVSNTIAPFSKYQLEQFVKASSLDIYQTRQLRMMIDVESENEQQTAGMIDLFDFEPYHNRAGVGIMIHEKWREQKIACRALQLFIAYVAQELGIRNLYCNIAADNSASIRLFTSLNFELIGCKKEWLRVRTEYRDELMFQLIIAQAGGNSASS